MKREINMRRVPASSDKGICAEAEMRADNSINTDPDGSYTGVPTNGDPYEKPVQDVDDL